jgi:hypothetical protein
MSETERDPNMTTQPRTLAEDVKIEDDAPLGMSQREEDAEAHRERLERFKADAENEQPELGQPRAPGDHAGSDDSSDGTTYAEGAPSQDPDPADTVPTGNIDDVKSWVGDDSDRAQQALDAEKEGQNRATLITWLEERV